PFTLPEFLDYRDRSRSLAGLSAIANWSANLTGSGEAERLQGARISANGFSLLRVDPVLGRTLLPQDDEPGAPRVVVITHGLWQRRFAGDPEVVGRTLVLNGDGYLLVGVLPPEFPFPLRDIELAVPLSPETDPLRNLRRSVNFLLMIGRLAPGVTREQAEEELSSICRQLREEFPSEYARKEAVKLITLHDRLVGGYRQALWVLLGAVAFVLLIACANLADLLLARASARQREIAVRTALGASKGRLIRQLFTENGLLAVLGGALGVLLATWGVELLIAVSPADFPRLAEVSIDARALAFTIGLTLVVGTVFGLAPVAHAFKVDANDQLKEGGRGGDDGRRGHRARDLLVVAEITLALVLLTGAGLLLRSFARLQAVEPGFDPDRLLVARLSLPKASYADRAAIEAFHQRLEARLETLPGVESVGANSVAPMSGLMASVPFTLEDRPALEAETPQAIIRAISPKYLRTMGIPLRQGRDFAERDTSETPTVVLINQTLAKTFFPDRSPV
ncbi:MAG: ABC transporter permease, partial [Candidatus Rokuibacteriota bacterium]